MKKILLFLVATFAFMTALAQGDIVADYLEKYSAYAVKEMQRSGVPASITLAQGMLESNYGRSELAKKANNHFGIQCGSAWKGKSYEHMDSGELRKFRKYKSALDSYKDHSDFLRGNRRYSSLFDLERTDYEGWAKGLKSAGYAEDPGYAEKLIKIIQKYSLHEYDVLDVTAEADEQKPQVQTEQPAVVEKPEQKQEVEQTVVNVQKVNRRKDDDKNTYRYPLSRQMYSQNGVPFIYATKDETYQQIAEQYDLFLREILSFNDVTADAKLPCGEVVYLQAKKGKAAKGCESYVVEEGMGMREISQKFAVRLKKLHRMNKCEEGHVPQVGDTIRLR